MIGEGEEVARNRPVAGELLVEGYEPTPEQVSAWRVAAPAESMARFAVTGVGVDRLRAAVSSVMDRHEILRTTLQRPRGMATPLAVIGSRPVWRADVYDGRNGELELVLRGPAYGLDAWSFPLLAGEIGKAIAGRLDSEPEPLEYADAAAWQQEILDGEEAVAARAYWRDVLPAGPVRLPYRLAGEAAAAAAERVSVDLDAPTLRALLGPADRGERSLRSSVLACWALTLARVVGQDVTVGVATDGRGYPELAAAVGPYARYVPVRLDTAAATSLAGLADQAESTLAEHSRWQDYVRLFRGRGTPFALDVVDLRDAYEDAGVQLTVTGWRTVIESCELRLVVGRTESGLDIEIEYASAYYADADVAALAAQMSAALSALQDAESAVPATVSLLTPEQRTFVTVGVNPPAPAGPPCLLHELVDRSAARSPDRTAVVAGSDEITYADLVRRADHLAAVLLGDGVGRGDLVAVALPAGIAAAVAHLGVLKAGAIVLPLDPDERGTNPSVPSRILLTMEPSVAGRLAADVVVRLSVDGTSAAAHSSDPASPTPHRAPISGLDLAYARAPRAGTSLATIDHRSVAGTVQALVEAVGLTSEDRMLAVAGPSSRAWQCDLFGTLAVGGTVVYVPEAGVADPAPWLRAAERCSITVWSSAPALFSIAIEFVRRTGELPAPLRLALLTGEALPGPAAARAREAVPHLRIENIYGTTGSSPAVLRHTVTAEDGTAPTVPVGRPLANQRCYVLDPAQQPCGVGIVGRLAIGGAGGEYGRLGEAGLTADRFRPDPFSPVPGARMYLTDDHARRCSDGSVLLVAPPDPPGAAGPPVPPAELTAALLRHPGVRQAATIARGADVVAFVAGDAAPGHIRTWIADRLIADVSHTAVVGLPMLPLTGNGRVDAAALVVPSEPVVAYVEPRNQLEEEVVALAAELLGVERVGLLDNFFRLGGHSLLLAQLSGRITAQFGVEVPLQRLFEAETMEEIAHLVLDAQLAAIPATEYAALVANMAIEDRAREDQGPASGEDEA